MPNKERIPLITENSKENQKGNDVKATKNEEIDLDLSQDD